MNHTYYVPVRTSDIGTVALRTGRLESGERIGIAFTSEAALTLTLGTSQPWSTMSDAALMDMLAPLGIAHLRIDPLPVGGCEVLRAGDSAQAGHFSDVHNGRVPPCWQGLQDTAISVVPTTKVARKMLKQNVKKVRKLLTTVLARC